LQADLRGRWWQAGRAVMVLSEDEAHLHLLPHVRSSWTRRGTRADPHTGHEPAGDGVQGAGVGTGVNHQAMGLPAGPPRRAADLLALLQMLAEAFPRARRSW